MRLKLLFAGVIFVTVLSGCLLGGSGGSGAQKLTFQDRPYVVSGNTIILPPNIISDTYCDLDSMVTLFDTTRADTIHYELSGNTLKLHSLRSLSSGAVVDEVTSFSRNGGGTGLEGTWSPTDASYRVVSGQMTASETADIDSSEQSAKRDFAAIGIELSFSGGHLIISRNAGPTQAQSFIDEWNGKFDADPVYSDSAHYAVTLTLVDANTVQLLGQKTGESVRITYSQDGDITYTSGNPAHPAYTFYAKPKSCPDNERPDWFFDFEQTNAKTTTTLQKSAVKSIPGSRKSGFWINFRPSL